MWARRLLAGRACFGWSNGRGGCGDAAWTETGRRGLCGRGHPPQMTALMRVSDKELWTSFPEANRNDILELLVMLLERLAVPAGPAAERDSPQTVETSVVVIMASMAGLLAPVPGRGRLVACPLSLLPGAAVVSGVKGGPQGPSPAGRCGAPLRPEGRPRTLSGRKKASGGAAASFSWHPRSGPAALTRRPFPPGTARNPPGCAFPAPSACVRGCSPRSTRRSRPAPRPWSRTCARIAAPIPAWSARTR